MSSIKERSENNQEKAGAQRPPPCGEQRSVAERSEVIERGESASEQVNSASVAARLSPVASGV